MALTVREPQLYDQGSVVKLQGNCMSNVTIEESTETPQADFEVPEEALMGGAEPVPTVQIS